MCATRTFDPTFAATAMPFGRCIKIPKPFDEGGGAGGWRMNGKSIACDIHNSTVNRRRRRNKMNIMIT